VRAAVALGALPGAAFLAWATHSNPWFLDRPLAYAPVVAIPALALGLALRRRRGPTWPLVAVALSLLASIVRPTPGAVAETRLLVFGMDGASWERIDALELPALAALERDGARAVLRSEEPMLSPILWTTMASGVSPDVHGIRGFRTRSDDCRAARFWDVARAHGQTVGLYKWLVTWPPDPALAFDVPAWLAATPETVPADLSFVKALELRQGSDVAHALEAIPRGLRWGTIVEALRVRLTDDPVALQRLRVAIDRDVLVWQLHRARPQVVAFVTYATDALGHTHWGTVALDDAYRQADAVLAEIRAQVPNATVVVLGDHGFRAADGRDAGTAFAPRTEALARILGVEVVRMGRKLVVLSPEVARVEAALAALIQSSTGAPLYRWEPTRGGLGLTFADERVDAARLASDTVAGRPLSDFASLTTPFSGEHDPDGVWLAAGPGIAPGRAEPMTLLDVAPTLLALLGLPAARDMPGTVRFGAELPRVPTYAHLVRARGEAAPAPVNEAALRALGYAE
jgi:hypothetical protein